MCLRCCHMTHDSCYMCVSCSKFPPCSCEDFSHKRSVLVLSVVTQFQFFHVRQFRRHSFTLNAARSTTYRTQRPLAPGGKSLFLTHSQSGSVVSDFERRSENSHGFQVPMKFGSWLVQRRMTRWRVPQGWARVAVAAAPQRLPQSSVAGSTSSASRRSTRTYKQVHGCTRLLACEG